MHNLNCMISLLFCTYSTYIYIYIYEMIWLICCVHYKISEFHMSISNSNVIQDIEHFDCKGLHQQKYVCTFSTCLICPYLYIYT